MKLFIYPSAPNKGYSKGILAAIKSIFRVGYRLVQLVSRKKSELLRNLNKTLENHARKSQPQDANLPLVFNYNTEVVNSNCTTFFTSLQWTSALCFSEPSPHPFPLPLPLRRSLLNICALVQIFYCLLCTG